MKEIAKISKISKGGDYLEVSIDPRTDPPIVHLLQKIGEEYNVITLTIDEVDKVIKALREAKEYLKKE